jgi:hypothetical protein
MQPETKIGKTKMYRAQNVEAHFSSHFVFSKIRGVSRARLTAAFVVEGHLLTTT